MSATFPTSTVTFLFSDIQGSTQLWEQHPDAMRSALAEHDAILRRTIASHDGQIVKTTGDGVHAAFGTAQDAVRAALEMQQHLQAPLSGLPIKVRIGLHSGEAELRLGDYYGQAPNRAARVMSLGHGGQILLSAITAELVREHLPSGAALQDLGPHRLKDLVRPENIYQLNASGLPADFPPLKSLDAFSHNLPLQLTSFIGREQEVQEAGQALAATRLLTFTGPGGAGKTRLSLQVAAELLDEFRDGVCLVELAPLAAAEYVVPTLASLLGLREISGLPLTGLVVDYLRARQMLLILDNCEHLVETCASLASQLLQACPALKLIASSREALGIDGEAVYRVPPLSLPDPAATAEALKASEAGRLFVERAGKAEPRFKLTGDNAPAVAHICRQLDGIPLAIELAAARVKLFTPQQIAARLDDRFKLLTGGSRTALPRQQTLRALIDWSYQTLDPAEQSLLRRLSVFAGGWTFDALEAVCGEVDALEALFGLVNKSLVNVDEQQENARYRFLETIRRYALEKLAESGEAVEAHDRHLDYFLELACQVEPSPFGPQSQERLDRLEIEYDNLRAALEWAVEHRPGAALQLADYLSGFWSTRDYHVEARYWSEKILRRSAGASGLDDLRARVYGVLGWVSAMQGDHQAGREASQAGYQLARQLNNTKITCRCLNSLAFSSMYLGDYAAAAQAVEESEATAREFGHTSELAMALIDRSLIQFLTGADLDEARQYLEESLLLGRAEGLHWVISFSVYGLARIAGARGDLAAARRLFDEAANMGRRVGNRQVIYASRSVLAHTLRANGELDEPLAIYKEVIAGWKEFGHRAAVAHELECMAYIYRRQGQAPRASRLLGAAEALRLEIGSSMTDMERQEYDDEVAALGEEMPEAELDRAWADGAAMGMDAAIALAISP